MGFIIIFRPLASLQIVTYFESIMVSSMAKVCGTLACLRSRWSCQTLLKLRIRKINSSLCEILIHHWSLLGPLVSDYPVLPWSWMLSCSITGILLTDILSNFRLGKADHALNWKAVVFMVEYSIELSFISMCRVFISFLVIPFQIMFRLLFYGVCNVNFLCLVWCWQVMNTCFTWLPPPWPLGQAVCQNHQYWLAHTQRVLLPEMREDWRRVFVASLLMRSLPGWNVFPLQKEARKCSGSWYIFCSIICLILFWCPSMLEYWSCDPR